jgi:hypothetical protein
VLKSIIFGNVCRYWYQNSNIDDYWHIIQQFASRLEAHGATVLHHSKGT